MTVVELIEDIRAGRNVKSAEESLYSILRAVLLFRLERKIPSHLRSRLDAEDVLHDAFLRAMQALDRFVPKNDQSFVAWVYRIAKNSLLDAGDRRSAIIPHFVGGDERKGPRESQVIDAGARATGVYRLHEWCEWALDRLSPEDREIVRLREIDGRSYEEIAEASGSTPAAVRQRHSRAMQKLREIVAREKG
jgi:RNA polymerase sigma-70 factor, ECF subfamily